MATDPEFLAMQNIKKILENLEFDARVRVWRWVQDKVRSDQAKEDERKLSGGYEDKGPVASAVIDTDAPVAESPAH